MDTKKVLADLYAERKRLDQAIAAIEELGGSVPTPKVAQGKASTEPKRRRTMSATARKRIAEAQRKRWARVRGIEEIGKKAPAAKKRAKKAAATTEKVPF
jgi:hypothetical protein